MLKNKVYISSTFRDLKPFRELIEKGIENEFSEVFELSKIMEHMYDTGKSVPFVDDCLEEVKESDVYLLILGDRVGSNPPNSDKTYTELEYETAIQNGKRVFRFVNKNFNPAECDNIEKYKTFKSKLEGLPSHEYSDLQTFENKFLKCMSYLLQQPLANGNNDRKFYYILAGILGLIALITTFITYAYTKDSAYNLAITALIPLLFSCIILYVLKNILFPTAMSTYK